MATLLRFAFRQSRLISSSKCLTKTHFATPVCSISTSKKNKDAVSVAEPIDLKPTSENLLDKEENWISYGLNPFDREDDAWGYHFIFFIGVTVSICGTGFLLAYWPDFRMRDWAHREAYLQLAAREKAGMPLIDKNHVDPEKITLPSDEELDDFEIII